jgi:hypothetical protein
MTISEHDRVQFEMFKYVVDKWDQYVRGWLDVCRMWFDLWVKMNPWISNLKQ